MRPQDLVFSAVTAWKEDRQGLIPGMTAVINVLVNRSLRDGTSIYAEATKRLQFSSLTASGDPELTLWPADSDPQWAEALTLAEQASNGVLADITNGAIDYYAPQAIKTTATFTLPNGTIIPFPKGWNPAAVLYTVSVGSQVYFKEV